MTVILEPRGPTSLTTGSERRHEVRMTTALPVLEIDGKRRRLLDFSAGGFRAGLPSAYRRVGATGHGVIHLTAAGHAVQKRITFQVMNQRGDSIGARYDVIEMITGDADTLF